MKSAKQAFTIVELLIVIVVIAILAAITIVAYNGITGQARETTLKSDLRTAATDLALKQTEANQYPSDYTPKPSAGNTLNYSGGGTSFCITATNPSLPGKTFHTTQDGDIKDGPCSGHPSTIAGSMQSFTPSQCNTLPVYTGSNESAVIGLTDNRGGTTRTYQVAKLADNKCWMLNNLKLGSTTASITLTPSDSNVTANFSLPQLITTGAISYDTPQAIGPVPGDTGSGITNYGYLYNWSAATAGESRTSHDNTKGDALNSICPVNWRLPSGGNAGEFAMLNAKMNNPSATAPDINTSIGYRENWQNNGPFKGAFSGGWGSAFTGQGSGASLWTRSTYASGVDDARDASFNADAVLPNDFNSRFLGFGVRCLLN